MADENTKVQMTEKQKVKEITDRLEAQKLLSTVEGYEDFVQELMNAAPVLVSFEEIPGDSKGYFDTVEKRIAVINRYARLLVNHAANEKIVYMIF